MRATRTLRAHARWRTVVDESQITRLLFPPACGERDAFQAAQKVTHASHPIDTQCRGCGRKRELARASAVEPARSKRCKRGISVA